jgi:hypothetical protein
MFQLDFRKQGQGLQLFPRALLPFDRVPRWATTHRARHHSARRDAPAALDMVMTP